MTNKAWCAKENNGEQGPRLTLNQRDENFRDQRSGLFHDCRVGTVSTCSRIRWNVIRITNYTEEFVPFAANQWLQFDVGPPTLITGLVTKGRADTRRKHWVTRFRVSYSNDSKVWYYYKDASHLDPKVRLLAVAPSRSNCDLFLFPARPRQPAPRKGRPLRRKCLDVGDARVWVSCCGNGFFCVCVQYESCSETKDLTL